MYFLGSANEVKNQSVKKAHIKLFAMEINVIFCLIQSFFLRID